VNAILIVVGDVNGDGRSTVRAIACRVECRVEHAERSDAIDDTRDPSGTLRAR